MTSPGCEARAWEGRAILHVDLDAFFAAVEQLDHPEWRGRPVIVGGDPSRRGVVSTCSYEARLFGVRSAMPSARAAALCPQAVWAKPSFGRYHEMSQAVFAIFRDETPLVQPVSVDEAFLDVTQGAYAAEHPVAIARRIRERIAVLGVTGSVGVATSKTVAKIASDHDKPDGLTVVCPGDEAAFLAPLPVRDMSGVGPRTAERLASLGVKTLGDSGEVGRGDRARGPRKSRAGSCSARPRHRSARSARQRSREVGVERAHVRDRCSHPGRGARGARRTRIQGGTAPASQGYRGPDCHGEAALLGLHDPHGEAHARRTRPTTSSSSGL